DIDACTARGITVTNTPFAVRRPVAVAALTLIFALSGRLLIKDRLVRTGQWDSRTAHMGVGLAGRRLGLIGAGGIGQELIPLARPFFTEIVAADPFADPDHLTRLGARPCAFAELLATADFVVALCPLTDQTRHLMNADAFAAMKPDAVFINVARGPIHDEAALIAALRAGTIAGAALDVAETEPLDPGSPLTAMDNVILTPHALCWTDECFEDIARTALGSIVDVSLGRTPLHIVT
ncbi:MAG: NAD(P)-dependent oxidoreductase, partial [Pseudomonadota bacterium]